MKIETRIFVFIFILFVAIFCLITGEHFREPLYSFDERLHLATTLSLLTKGSLHFDPIDSQTTSKFGILPAILAIPFYAVGSVISDIFQLEGAAKSGVVYHFIYLVNAFITALLLAFFYRFSRLLKYPRRSAFYSTVTLGLCTMILPYTKYFYISPIAGLLLFLSWMDLFKWSRKGKTGHLVRSGVWFGLLLLTRVDNITLVPIALLAISRKMFTDSLAGEKWHSTLISKKAIIRYAAFLVPVIGGMGAHLFIEYLKYRGQPSGYVGEAFSTNLFHGVFGNLFSAGRSIFLYSPPLVFAFIFFPRFSQRHFFAGFLVAGAVLMKLFLFGKWWGWNGGMCIGPRFLLPVVPLFCLALNEGFYRWKRLAGWIKGIGWISFLSGLYVQILTVLVRPGLLSENFHVMAGGDENQMVYIPNIAGIFPASGIIRMGIIDNWMASWRHFLPIWSGIAVLALAVLIIIYSALKLVRVIRPKRSDFAILSPDCPEVFRKAFRGILLVNFILFLVCYTGKNLNIIKHDEVHKFKDRNPDVYTIPSRQIAIDRHVFDFPENLLGIQMQWKGELLLPLKGRHIFYLKANGGATFQLDEKTLIVSRHQDPQSTKRAELDLSPGYHSFRIYYTPRDLTRHVLHLYVTFPGCGVDRELITNRYVFQTRPGPLLRAFLYMDNFKFLAPLFSLLILAMLGSNSRLTSKQSHGSIK